MTAIIEAKKQKNTCWKFCHYEASSNTFKMSTTVLADAYALCAGEAFAHQPTAAFCSGTVVQWDDQTKTGLVATAGHCFDSDEVSEGCQMEHTSWGLDLDVRATSSTAFRACIH